MASNQPTMAARFLAEDPRHNMFSEDDDDDDGDGDDEIDDEGRWNNKRSMADPATHAASNSKEDAAIEEMYRQNNKKQRTKRSIVSIPQLKDILTTIPNHFKMIHHQKRHPKLQNTVPCMGQYLRSMLAMYHQDIFQANQIDVPLIQKLAPQLKGFLQDLRLHVTRNPHLEATLGEEAAHRLMQQLDERTNDTPTIMAANTTSIAASTAQTAISHHVAMSQASTIVAPAPPAVASNTANNPYSKSRGTTTAAAPPTRALRNEESLQDNTSSATTLQARQIRQRCQVLDDTSDEEELQFNDDQDYNAFARKKAVICEEEDNDETSPMTRQVQGTAKVVEDTQEANEITEEKNIMNEPTFTPVFPIQTDIQIPKMADTQKIQIASDDTPSFYNNIQTFESPYSPETDCRSILEVGESSETDKPTTNDDTNLVAHATANNGPKAIYNNSDHVAILATGTETSISRQTNSSTPPKSKDSLDNLTEDSGGMKVDNSSPADFTTLETNSLKLGQETQEMMTDDEDEIATIIPTMLSGPTQLSP